MNVRKTVILSLESTHFAWKILHAFETLLFKKLNPNYYRLFKDFEIILQFGQLENEIIIPKEGTKYRWENSIR